MNAQTIDGKCYVRMLLGGAALLAAHVEELNALNVFPVSDGDTGSNMLKTIEGGLAELDKESLMSIGDLSKLFARGVLLAARGNSGVILSQIFAGINEGLQDFDNISALDLARAYQKGIVKSYSAVQNPTEGTILTVFRESTDYAVANLTEESTVNDFFRLHIEEARRSLAATKELLPVLAEADVVDSGAAGYLYIAEGMYNALNGATVSYDYGKAKENSKINIDLFTRDSVLEYGYCTEFLLRLTTAKVNPDKFEISTVLSVLEELNGESIVAYQQGDIVKVHVHTFSPGEVLARMQAFGEFLTVKVENMSLGHSESKRSEPKNNKSFSLVAVTSGDGIAALFTQMGVDQIISGGQTANPSIEDFLKAFENCETDDIIVFPNNKNILLAARQAAEIHKESKVHIVETQNLMQGYSALSVITPGITDMEALIASAERAANDVIDGEITKAVRDTTIDGLSIKCGDYIAISKGKIVVTADNAEDVVLKLLETLDIDLYEIITLFVGRNVSDEQRVKLTEKIQELYNECEVVVYEGGQDIYNYYIAVE